MAHQGKTYYFCLAEPENYADKETLADEQSEPTSRRVHGRGTGFGGSVRVPVRAVGGEPARVGLVRGTVVAGQHGLRNPRRAPVPQAGRE